jgi:hypothetical protein
MCGSNPEVAPEVNKAKCFAGCAIGFGMATFGFGLAALILSRGASALGYAWVSSIGGLLGVIGGLMLCCCGPKSKGQGGGLHLKTAVLAILSTICYLVGAILCVVVVVAVTLDPLSAFRPSCTSLPCYDIDTSCSSRCEKESEDFANTFSYDEGEGERWAYYYYKPDQGWVEGDPVWERRNRECQEGCKTYPGVIGELIRVVTLAVGVPTIVFSLIAIGLQIPLIIFCFKAKKVIDAEAGPTAKL